MVFKSCRKIRDQVRHFGTKGLIGWLQASSEHHDGAAVSGCGQKVFGSDDLLRDG
jgi:hypothetical protein